MKRPQWLMPLSVPIAKWLAGRLYDIDIGSLVPEESAARLS